MKPIYYRGELSPMLAEQADTLGLVRIHHLTNHKKTRPGAPGELDWPKVDKWLADYVPQGSTTPIWGDLEQTVPGRKLWFDALQDDAIATNDADEAAGWLLMLAMRIERLRPGTPWGWYGVTDYIPGYGRPTPLEELFRFHPLARQLCQMAPVMFPGSYSPDLIRGENATRDAHAITAELHGWGTTCYPTVMHRRAYTSGPEEHHHKLWTRDEIMPHLELLVGFPWGCDGFVSWDNEAQRAELAFQTAPDGAWKYATRLYDLVRQRYAEEAEMTLAALTVLPERDALVQQLVDAAMLRWYGWLREVLG